MNEMILFLVYKVFLIFIGYCQAYQQIVNKNFGFSGNCIPDQQGMWSFIGGGSIKSCYTSCVEYGTSTKVACMQCTSANNGIKLTISTSKLTDPYSIIGVDYIYAQVSNLQARINLNNQATKTITSPSYTVYEESKRITCGSNNLYFQKASIILYGTINTSTFFTALDQNTNTFYLKQIRIWTNCCENCLQCASSTTCLICMDGFSKYTFDNDETVCAQTRGCSDLKCEQCAKYNGDEVCIKCEPNYYLDGNGACQENQPGNTCTSSTKYVDQGLVCRTYSTRCWYQYPVTLVWTQCGGKEFYSMYECPYNKQVLIYYYENYYIYQCSCVIKNCEFCTNQTGCTACYPGYNFNAGTQTCDLICANNQYYDSGSTSCINCGSNCQTCDSTGCHQCVSSLYYISISSPNDCFLCAIANCETCYGDGLCSVCQSGFELSADRTQCNIVCQVYNCQTCNPSNGQICQTCVTNYLLSGDQSSCDCQVSNCNICQLGDGLMCDSCITNYILNGLTYQCDCQVPNCSLCNPSDGLLCTSCVNNYLLSADESQCQCQVANCLTCEQINGQLCSICQIGYNLDPITKLCTCAVANCSVCNATNGGNCDTCVNNYLLSGNTQVCSCQVPNCLSCQIGDGLKCSTCQTGYILNAVTNQCECAVAQCQTCDSLNGTLCNACIFQYSLSTNKQQCSCQAQSCSSCDPVDGQKCSICFQGYLLNAVTATCECSVLNCSICDPIDGGVCNTCNTNYYPNQAKTLCESCAVNNCLNCQSNDYTKCTLCSAGFSLNYDKTICGEIKNDNSYLVNIQLVNSGYKVIFSFQEKLVNVNMGQIISNMSLTIPGFTQFSYQFLITGDDELTAEISVSENMKSAKVQIDFQVSSFVQDNRITDLSYTGDLPPFVIISTEVRAAVAQVSTVTKGVSKSIISSFLPIAIFGNFYFLVNMIDLTSFLYYLMFLDIRYPLNVTEFYGLFKDFQFPFIPNFFVDVVTPGYQQQSPKKFMDMGVDCYLLNNSGSMMTICFGVIGLYILVKIAHKVIPIRRIHAYFSRIVYETWEYGAFIDMMATVYLYILIGCFVQTLSFDTSDETSYLINYLFYGMWTVICVIGPLIMTAFVFRQKNLKSDQHMQTKISSFISGLKIEDENPQLVKQEEKKSIQLNEEKPENQNYNDNHLALYDNEFGSSENNEKERKLPQFDEVIKELTEEDQVGSPVLERPSKKGRELKARKIIRLQNVSTANQKGSDGNDIIDTRTRREKHIAKYSKMCSSFLYIRKILFSLIIVFLYGKCYLQLSLLCGLNICIVSYIAYIQPYLKQSENLKNGACEIVLMVIQVCAFMLVEDNPQESEDNRLQIGWAIVCLSAFILLWNTIILVKDTLLSLYDSIKKLCQKNDEYSKQQQNKVQPLNGPFQDSQIDEKNFNKERKALKESKTVNGLQNLTNVLSSNEQLIRARKRSSIASLKSNSKTSLPQDFNSHNNLLSILSQEKQANAQKEDAPSSSLDPSKLKSESNILNGNQDYQDINYQQFSHFNSSDNILSNTNKKVLLNPFPINQFTPTRRKRPSTFKLDDWQNQSGQQQSDDLNSTSQSIKKQQNYASNKKSTFSECNNIIKDFNDTTSIENEQQSNIK